MCFHSVIRLADTTWFKWETFKHYYLNHANWRATKNM